MLSRIFNYLLLFMLLSFPLSAQTITESGKSINLPDSVLSDKKNLNENIVKYYSNNGYLNILIDTLYTSETIDINKGCRFKIDEFSYFFNPNHNKKYKFEYGGFYSSQTVENYIKSKQQDFIDEGYIKTEATITTFDINIDSCSVNILVQYDKSNLYYTNGLSFIGNNQNSDKFLARISNYSDSTIANKQNLDLIKQRLLQSDLFNSVSDAMLFKNNQDNIVLAYQVDERNLNTLDGVIGLVTNSSGKNMLVGNFSASLGNLFTDGNQFILKYDKININMSRLQLNAEQNYIANTSLGLNAGFSIFQNDTTYQTRTWNIGGTYSVSNGLKLKAGVKSSRSVSSIDDGTELEPNGKKIGFNVGFNFRTINNYDVPTNGMIFDLDMLLANKIFDDKSMANQKLKTISSTFENYYAVTNRIILKNAIYGYLAETTIFTLEDLFRFGGANSLRGYNEEQLLASQVGWTDLEFRYLVNPGSYFLIFGTAGAYHRPKIYNEMDNSFKITESLYSGGVGLSYRTAIGRLSFIYALSPNDDFSNGKVHFGIKTSL